MAAVHDDNSTSTDNKPAPDHANSGPGGDSMDKKLLSATEAPAALHIEQNPMTTPRAQSATTTTSAPLSAKRTAGSLTDDTLSLDSASDSEFPDALSLLKTPVREQAQKRPQAQACIVRQGKVRCTVYTETCCTHHIASRRASWHSGPQAHLYTKVRGFLDDLHSCPMDNVAELSKTEDRLGIFFGGDRVKKRQLMSRVRRGHLNGLEFDFIGRLLGKWFKTPPKAALGDLAEMMPTKIPESAKQARRPATTVQSGNLVLLPHAIKRLIQLPEDRMEQIMAIRRIGQRSAL
ncbi:hypothetical protein DL89DRAFT_272032 [Linderina pennispora]|uniref:Uncharacterized protein n=1 Tax=Linderina pennispora TaxID=61395 RepID=A0A1Y1VU24_9FUNG|nr:uncharacterized protein DL89DRAFT_272032 [Linderina pennispora]ORX64683.1 hypothetical protein DL89DRAFT_272032 [Linderina pennispora]